MKAKVFVFLFCIIFNLSSVFAAELKKVRFSDEYKIENYDISMLSEYKYIFAVRGETYTEIVGFNDLSHIKYEYSDSGNALRVIFLSRDLTENDKAIKVQYISSDFSYFYTFKFQGGQNGNFLLNAIPLEGDESSYLFYTNFDIVFDGLETFPSMTDDTIGDPNSRLQVTYEYNEDNTECKINATIKDGSFTDKIFYSNYMPGPSGHLLTKQPFPIDGITVTENQSLFFQAEDKDGNIIATNSISIYGIGKLNPELFIVDIDVENGGHAYFTPRLLNSGYIYNDIYCKIDNVSGLRITKDGFNLDLTDYSSEFAEGKLISSGQTWNIANFSLSDCTFNIHFEIKNRETGVTMLTKTYNLTIKLKSNGSINGGTINSGQDDEEIMTPDNDDNINNDLNVGIDWSLESSIDNIKNFFVTATEFFNLVLVFLNSLPMWIIMPLYTLFTLAIIIFVFHAIRG